MSSTNTLSSLKQHYPFKHLCVLIVSGICANRHFLLTSFSLPFHFLFTSFPLPFHFFFHFLFTSFLLPFHFFFASFSLPFQFLFTSFSLPFHFFFTSFSLPFTVFSHPLHFLSCLPCSNFLGLALTSSQNNLHVQHASKRKSCST